MYLPSYVGTENKVLYQILQNTHQFRESGGQEKQSSYFCFYMHRLGIKPNTEKEVKNDFLITPDPRPIPTLFRRRNFRETAFKYIFKVVEFHFLFLKIFITTTKNK